MRWILAALLLVALVVVAGLRRRPALILTKDDRLPRTRPYVHHSMAERFHAR